MSAQFTTPAPALAPSAALAIGTRIERFTVLQVLHEGRFGSVYLARDQAHGLTRVLKEFLPRQLATRRPDGEVVPRSAGDANLMSVARLGFAHEANTLAAIDQPGLVRVLGLLNVHHTLYRVMPLYDGVTLERRCRERSAAPTVRWLAGIVDDLLAALEALHSRGQAHGRVQPDQVLVSDLDRATLLGFGSVARHLDDDADAALWRAPEGDEVERHVPPTQANDLYGLAATAWFAATGEAAPTIARRSSGRPGLVQERLAVLADSQGDAPSLRGGLINAIEAGLALPGLQRPATVADFRRLLRGEPLTHGAPADLAPSQACDGPVPVLGSDAFAAPAAPAKAAAFAASAPADEVEGDAEAVAIAPVLAARAMLAARVAARQANGPASMPLRQPQSPGLDVAPATPESAVTAGVEREWVELSWQDKSRVSATASRGAASPGVAAVAAAARKPVRAVKRVTRMAPSRRRTAPRMMALALVALASVALVGWITSPPGAHWVATSVANARAALARAAQMPGPAAPSLVGEDARGGQGTAALASANPADAGVAPAPFVAAAVAPTSVAPAVASQAISQATAPPAARPDAKPRPSAEPSSSEARRESKDSMSAAVPALAAATTISRSPADLCSNRTRFSYVYCMQQQCARPSQRYHRQCIEFLRDG